MWQPDKCTFWEKNTKVEKLTISYFMTTFPNFVLKTETGGATRMVIPILKTRNGNDDAC